MVDSITLFSSSALNTSSVDLSLNVALYSTMSRGSSFHAAAMACGGARGRARGRVSARRRVWVRAGGCACERGLSPVLRGHPATGLVIAAGTLPVAGSRQPRAARVSPPPPTPSHTHAHTHLDARLHGQLLGGVDRQVSDEVGVLVQAQVHERLEREGRGVRVEARAHVVLRARACVRVSVWCVRAWGGRRTRAWPRAKVHSVTTSVENTGSATRREHHSHARTPAQTHTAAYHERLPVPRAHRGVAQVRDERHRLLERVHLRARH